MQGLKFDMEGLENILRPWRVYEAFLVLPLLGNLEQIEDLNGNVLSKMRGKILGYNSFPCSIFLNLRMQIGFRAFRNPKVEVDCPEICTRLK